MDNTKCWCGRPLHYKLLADKDMVEHVVEKFGEFVHVTLDSGKTYKVQRHYIALHGITNKDLTALGFEELSEA